MPFFDIFSKSNKETKKQKQIEKPKIIIDNKEKNSLVASNLVSLGAEIEFKQLEVADYLVKDVAIERKTLSDLQGSIMNKRVFDQLNNLKQYKNRFLLIEGDSEIFIHENAIRGFILSASLDFKTPIIFTKNELDTAKYLLVLAKRDKKELSLRQSITFKSKLEQQQFILEGFPGIGPVTAKALLKKFKSIKNIINAQKEELEEILKTKSRNFQDLID